MVEQKAERFNTGKNRYDLLDPFAIDKLTEVFTYGSNKYSDHNWLKGLKWSNITSSLKRHLAEYEAGTDYDSESSLLHAQHIAWNAMALLSHYKYHPQLDDRHYNKILANKKVSLDLDDCIVTWCEEWAKKHNHPEIKNWCFSYKTGDNFVNFGKEELNEFYTNLPAKVKPEDIKFNVHCYITSRSIDENITKQWIENNGFPTKPVYSVGFGESKVEAFKASGADYHIDDSYDNYVELTNAGICCFLLTTPHNEKYEIGHRRIKDFNDFKERFL